MDTAEKLNKRGAPPGARQKTSGYTIETTRELLKHLASSVVPDSGSLRKTVDQLMPNLYVLHTMGFTFGQISSFLSQVNIKIQVGTLRIYYTEFLDKNMDLCQESMNEQLLILNELRKETANHSLTTIPKKIHARQAEKHSDIDVRINKIINGLNPDINFSEKKTNTYNFQKQDVNSTVGTVDTTIKDEKSTALSDNNPDDTGDFGLLIKKTSSKTINAAVDGEPQIPDLLSIKAKEPTIPAANGAVTQAPLVVVRHALRCGPLQQGVNEIPVRKDVPAVVYGDELLEHPAIPGLMLSKEQRLYGAQLEIVDESGQSRLESIKDEKPFRIKWQAPIQPYKGSTSENFVKLNTDLFKTKE